MRFSTHVLILAIWMATAWGQVTETVRKAELRGGGGTSGKCTVEVRVDMMAEVDLYGDSGRLRTLAGQPATWTRLECTGPLPYTVSDFRLRGIDGRGSVKLQADPRNNNSMAVIRVEDPQGGAEGYTFDVEWSGASGGSPTDGFASGWGTPAGATNTTGAATTGVGRRQRGWGNQVNVEQAMELCKTELRARGERDYGLRNLTITATAMDTAPGRREWVTGAFTDRAGYRRGGSYKFNCRVDPASSQVSALEILRADGTVLQPGATTGTATGWGTTTTQGTGTYDQNKVLRACQDAAVERARRDGYQNLAFQTTAVDGSRANRVTGSATAARGPVTDTFDFACTMNFSTAAVENVEWTRR